MAASSRPPSKASSAGGRSQAAKSSVGEPVFEGRTRARKGTEASSLSRSNSRHKQPPAGELCHAASKGDVKRLRQLVQDGAAIDEGNYDSRTALHLAASQGLLSCARCLVEELGADVGVADRWGGTPLDDAIRGGHTEVVKLLISKKGTRGRTSCLTDDAGLLCDAGSKGDIQGLAGLMQRGVDVNLGDYDRRTALHLAASEGRLKAVQFLVAKMKANINVKDRWGGTPLDDSIRSGHDSVHHYLESKGALRGKTSSLNDADNATVLVNAASEGDLARLRDLKKKGVDMNSCDYDQRTALHLASSEGLLLVVKCLVEELGADVHVVDRWGGTPLDDALRSEHAGVADYLRSKEALRGKTAVFASDAIILCCAAAAGDLETLRGLSKQQIDINLGDHDERTALHHAAAHGQLDSVKFLVEELQADQSRRDRWGNTPLDESMRSMQQAVVSYLQPDVAAEKPASDSVGETLSATPGASTAVKDAEPVPGSAADGRSSAAASDWQSSWFGSLFCGSSLDSSFARRRALCSNSGGPRRDRDEEDGGRWHIEV